MNRRMLLNLIITAGLLLAAVGTPMMSASALPPDFILTKVADPSEGGSTDPPPGEHSYPEGTTVSIVFLYLPLIIRGGGDDESAPIGSTHDVNTCPISDSVYDDDGGFVITDGMLDRPYNEITFPGTHNSYAGKGDNWTEYRCKNQGLTIAEQLANGIRYIEFDIDGKLYVRHGACWGHLNERLEQIRDYVRAHPNQVITVRIADLQCEALGCIPPGLPAPSPEYAYMRVNHRLRELGLDDYIYNWNEEMSDDDPDKCFIPETWPTLGAMIESGKTVMFFHHRDYPNHGIFDEGYSPGLRYSDNKLHEFYDVPQLEQLSRSMPVWAPPQDRQKDGPNRLFLMEVTPDANTDAGNDEDASRNNDGRKLYQLAKQHEDDILPDGRVVNFINVDYFMSSHAGSLPIDVVDASNRLNYERFGIDWQNSEYSWELYPYEFDRDKIELIGQVAGIRAEVEEVIEDHSTQEDVEKMRLHARLGMIVSTRNNRIYDWLRLPEWAVDNDFFTRWAGASSGPNHTWAIDLGAMQFFDEIAIAWEFPHKAPAYTFYVSIDDRFADGISREELREDDGWLPVVVQLDERPHIEPAELWDRRAFDLDSLGLDGARYLKIKVTDADVEYWPSFYEVRLYQPIIPVSIDIKPGSYPNSINLGSQGVTPVAIFSSDTFDATTIDPATVTLAGARVKVPGNSGKYLCHNEDVNEDSIMDIVCQVRTNEFSICPGATTAVLEAETTAGRVVRGEDSIRIVPD